MWRTIRHIISDKSTWATVATALVAAAIVGVIITAIIRPEATGSSSFLISSINIAHLILFVYAVIEFIYGGVKGIQRERDWQSPLTAGIILLGLYFLSSRLMVMIN